MAGASKSTLCQGRRGTAGFFVPVKSASIAVVFISTKYLQLDLSIKQMRLHTGYMALETKKALQK
jgi:hypothetical protein